MNCIRLLSILIIFSLCPLCLNAFPVDHSEIKGTVLDRETKKPISDASVSIVELNRTGITDSSGIFQFTEVPYGSYRIKVSMLGYEPIVKTDIVVLSARPAEVLVELNPLGFTTQTIEVRAKYFEKPLDLNASVSNLDFEEVRRAPGAVEDISRMVQSLPGVSSANDQRNDLIVRGGSPAENLILVDGIEMPNINHFPSQGSSSGPIGMINVKFINDVNFSSGGFPVRFGDRLSSVLDIKFRDGQRSRFLSDINLSSAGFGGVFEGPLFSEKGSFLFSVRRSYLSLIKSAIRLSAVPNYWDFNLKVSYDVDENNKLHLVGIAGIDDIKFEGSESEQSDDNPYGKAVDNQKQMSAGLNWRSLFKKGYVQTVFSNFTGDNYLSNREFGTDSLLFNNDSFESEYSLRSEVFYQLNTQNSFVAGIGGKYVRFKNDMYIAPDTTAFGDTLPALIVNASEKYFKASAFGQYTIKLFKDKFLATGGIRYDYFSGINDKNVFSPRIGFSYKISPVTTLNLSGGIFYQAPQYLWVTGDTGNVNLKFVRADHIVAGVEHLFTADLKLTVEAYYKKYTDYPVSLKVPTWILANGGADYGPNLVGPASSDGFGFVRGIDFSLHKKLIGNGLYGMLNYTLSESRFTALKGGEKPGSFDYRHNITLIAGYQIADEWLVGIKFRYATGRPYTPYDEQLSTIIGRGVYQVDKFNEARYKDYNRLDIRVDKKWNFRKLSIVSYIELQNVFNTTNVYQYFWNEYKNEQGTIYQWAFLPVGGFSIQF